MSILSRFPCILSSSRVTYVSFEAVFRQPGGPIMKSTFKKNKLVLAFIVSISPLCAAPNIPPKKVINLLKKTDSALAGWYKLQYKWLWSGSERQSRIISASNTLKDTQKELATLLAQLNTDNQTFTYEDYKTILAQSAEHIKTCAPPSYFKRNWIRYSLSAIGLVGGAYLFSKHGYDEDGNHLIENFYIKHIKKPTINTYDILTHKNTDQTVLEQDSKEALKRFQNKLDLFIENAKTDPELSRLVINHIPQNTTIKNIPLKNKLAFLDATLTFIHTHIPTEAVESCKTFKLWNWGSIPHLKAGLESHILLLQQLRVEKMLATNKVDEVSQKVNLSIELIAAIPALVTSYLCFKSLNAYITNRTANSTYRPLKKILIKLQLQCNQERYSTSPSLITQGMNIYWLSQLKDALHSIPTEDRIAYCEYLERLESSDLRPEQKITVIENMLRDVSFLQKV